MNDSNFFSGGGIDRAGLRRKDTDWVAARLVDPATRILLFWRDHHLVTLEADARAVLLAPPEAEALGGGPNPHAFLGFHGEGACFAIDISHMDEPLTHPGLAGRGEFVDIREVGSLLGRAEAQLMAFSRGLFYWHGRHRFCGACGAPTEAREAGHVRVCTDPACGISHFPRTDPAVIMLVLDGDRCLMGRRPGRKNFMYSTLAGFVEPGESLEEAVAREVMEEAGVHVGEVRYAHSQPWPFPANLMLGFYADAASTEITVHADELADARWFTRADVRDLMKIRDREDSAARGGVPHLPRPVSIARRLIRDWLDGRAG